MKTDKSTFREYSLYFNLTWSRKKYCYLVQVPGVTVCYSRTEHKCSIRVCLSKELLLNTSSFSHFLNSATLTRFVLGLKEEFWFPVQWLTGYSYFSVRPHQLLLWTTLMIFIFQDKSMFKLYLSGVKVSKKKKYL